MDRQLSTGNLRASGLVDHRQSSGGRESGRRARPLSSGSDWANKHGTVSNPDHGLRINWDVDGGADAGEAGSALREANEIADMIDSTLGIHSVVEDNKPTPTGHLRRSNDYEDVHNAIYEHNYHSSPSTPNGHATQSPHLHQHQRQPVPAPYSPVTASEDMLCIKVLRAYDLPDVLGGTNPYILFDWGHLGRASTHAVKNTTAPEYNATLRFKSPSEHGSSLSTALMNSPPLSVTVHSRRESMPDKVIGGIQLDDKDMNSSHPLRVYLYSDEEQVECGILEFQVYVI